MRRIWQEGSLGHKVKLIISHLRMGFRCHHSTRKTPHDQPFLKAKTAEKTSTPPPKTTKPTANSTTKKTKSQQAREESNIINFILILLKEPLKWCVSNISQLVWWGLIKTSRLSKCKIWIVIVRKCTKATTATNSWTTTAWTFLNLIIKCTLPILISHLKTHQNQRGF